VAQVLIWIAIVLVSHDGTCEAGDDPVDHASVAIMLTGSPI
jgi:hypothetical protein